MGYVFKPKMSYFMPTDFKPMLNQDVFHYS